MTRRARRECAACTRVTVPRGRGLCHTCYDNARNNGTLHDYSTYRERNADRNTRIITALRAGTSVTDVAAALDLTYDTVRSIARAEGIVGDGCGAIPSSWLREVPAAPTTPPCAGEVMDFDGLKPHELTPERNMHVRDGLALCAECPLATRQWCLDVMDPEGLSREWQGIAGGIVWSHGRVVYMSADRAQVAS